MQPDTDDTSVQFNQGEWGPALALHSVLELVRTQDADDRDTLIQKNELLFRATGFSESFIDLYLRVGVAINMTLLSLRALGNASDDEQNDGHAPQEA